MPQRRERMMHLCRDAPGLGGPRGVVVPAQVGVDRSVLLNMAAILGAVEGVAAEGPELALDEVQPARVGGQVDELDVVAGGRLPELRLVVGAEVVEDHDEVLAEASRSVRGSSRTLLLIDPDQSALNLPRVLGREPLLVEGVDELGHVGRAGPEHQRDLRHALSLERGKQ